MTAWKEWNSLVEYMQNHEWPEVTAQVDIEGEIDEIIPELDEEPTVENF